MGVQSVAHLKGGEVLKENVVTERGNILFQKGKNLVTRDLQILRAFMVQQVEIQSDDADTGVKEEKKQPQQAQIKPASSFETQYQEFVLFIKKIFLNTSTNSAAGGTFPILEIRKKLGTLLQSIDQYQILMFHPRQNKNEKLFHDSVKASVTSFLLAQWHGLSQKDWVQVALGGLLHDIGMMHYFHGSHNTEEVMKHPVVGYSVLKNVTALNEGAKLCALQHHEHENGSGYPLKVKGDKIHSYAKIVIVAERFHQLFTTGVSPYVALEELNNMSFGKINPQIVQTFINKTTSFHNGEVVKLNDDRVGEIVYIDRSTPTRPWVKINGEIINLAHNRSLHIKEIFKK